MPLAPGKRLHESKPSLDENAVQISERDNISTHAYADGANDLLEALGILLLLSLLSTGGQSLSILLLLMLS